ncbi:MAG: serine/threonine-protein kinase [Gemmataceae bacterium]
MSRGDPNRETVAGPVAPVGVGDTLAPGLAVAGYVVESVLGSGAMGVVYRAHQTALDRTVALKTVKLGRADFEFAIGRFFREAKAVARLRHPNIVTAFDCGQQNDVVYYTMELLDGESLDDWLRRGEPIDESFGWHVIRQAAAGLAHAAAAGVVHRDVKPGNLFVTPPPTGYPLPAGVPMVKVTDFGLASVHESAAHDMRLTSSGMVVGTPLYMAPEQLSGAPADIRADIYALGITAFEMLAGRTPFVATTVWDLLREKAVGIVGHEERMSPASQALIRDMTAPNATARPKDYSELIARIDAVLATTATTQPAAVKSSKKLHKSLWWLAAAALVTGLAVYGSTVLAKRAGPTAPPPGYEASTPIGLFRGVVFGDWKPIDGQWIPVPDAEKGTTLSGRNGTIRRVLPGEYQKGDFRLTLGADLYRAKAIELHFAIATIKGSRLVIRVSSADGVALGRQESDEPSDETPFNRLTNWRPLRAGDDDGPAYPELKVERVAGRWYAAYAGKWIAGSLDDGEPTLNEFRLRAEGGEARFTEIEAATLTKVK